MAKRLRLVILGAMGLHPLGGQTWLFLNWLRGFAALGHEVYYVEDRSTWPYDPLRLTRTPDCAYARGHIESCMQRIGLPDRWALRATRLQTTDPVAANRLWARTDRRVTNQAPWVTTVSESTTDLVSRRVSNYQYAQSVAWLDQLWVR